MAKDIIAFIPFIDAPNLNYATDPRAAEKYIRYEFDCVQIVEAYRNAYGMPDAFITWRTPKAYTSPKEYWVNLVVEIAKVDVVIFPPLSFILWHNKCQLISRLCDEMHVPCVELTDADLRIGETS